MATYMTTTQESRSFHTLLLAVAIDPDEIGHRIKRARERRGWTQLVMANEANVSPSTVQRWESGRLPPVRELIRIADVLGVPTDELVEPEPDEVAELQARYEAEIDRLASLNDRLEARLAEQVPPRRTRKPA